MEQPEEVEEYKDDDAQINQDESKIEAIFIETKERENRNKMPRRANSGKGADRLNMKFGGSKYDTQFTSTGNKILFFNDMQKLAVYVTFKQMTPRKGIKKHRER